MGRVEQLGVEFDSHGGANVVIERGGGIGESGDEGGFADAGIAEHDDFVERRFGCGGGGSVGHAIFQKRVVILWILTCI